MNVALFIFLCVAARGQSSSSHLPKERELHGVITAFGPDLYLTYSSTEFDVSPQAVKK
jgi:hypothetical protein